MRARLRRSGQPQPAAKALKACCWSRVGRPKGRPSSHWLASPGNTGARRWQVNGAVAADAAAPVPAVAADAASHRLCSAAATRPAASLVKIATAKASTILPTLAYAADATVASHLRACTLASLRARVLALASPRAHSACAGVAACTERRAQEAMLAQRGIRQAGWRRIHRIHPRARSHASGGGMRQRCTAARHFRPQLETAL